MVDATVDSEEITVWSRPVLCPHGGDNEAVSEIVQMTFKSMGPPSGPSFIPPLHPCSDWSNLAFHPQKIEHAPNLRQAFRRTFGLQVKNLMTCHTVNLSCHKIAGFLSGLKASCDMGFTVSSFGNISLEQMLILMMVFVVICISQKTVCLFLFYWNFANVSMPLILVEGIGYLWVMLFGFFNQIQSAKSKAVSCDLPISFFTLVKFCSYFVYHLLTY